MNKTILAATAAVFAFTAPAAAADVDRQLGLIVSGVVDSWAGVQIDNGLRCCAITGDSDAVFTNGGQGLLSLPLGENLSIQSDVKYEYNSDALDNTDASDVVRNRYSFQGAVHLSWRDPSSGLFGIFGGVGSTNFGGDEGHVQTNARFVGGEAQMYVDNVTLYGQAGYVNFSDQDFENGPGNLDEGFFARGVVRWFMTPDSRIQLEAQYINADYRAGFFGDVDSFSVGARYDFTLAGLPIIGDTPIYVGYRGTFRDNCFFGSDYDSHTIMIGTSYSFAGDLLTVDRQGATLDTPNFDSCYNNQDQINGGGQD